MQRKTTRRLYENSNALYSAFLSLVADYPSDYYGPAGNYEYFQGPPSSQAQTPADLGYVPSTVPVGTPLGVMDHHHHQQHQGLHRSTELQCFPAGHHPADSPSPEPHVPGSGRSMSGELCGPGPPYANNVSGLSDSGYTNQLSQPSSEMSEGTAW